MNLREYLATPLKLNAICQVGNHSIFGKHHVTEYHGKPICHTHLAVINEKPEPLTMGRGATSGR